MVQVRRLVRQTASQARDWVVTRAASLALARRPIEGHDSLAIACRSLRDRADGLIAEYGREGTSAARRQEIISELRNIGSDWNTIGCRDSFGDIALELPRPKLGNRAVPTDLQQALRQRSEG
jgi:hypothetical protein